MLKFPAEQTDMNVRLFAAALPAGLRPELLERLGVRETLDPEASEKEAVDVDNMSVTLHDLTNLEHLEVAVPLSDLTIRNSSALPRLVVHKVSQRLALENLPSLQRLELRGLTPKEVHLRDLPALTPSPNRALGSGIAFNGLLTESIVRSLGDYAAAITDISSITMKALVAWLPHNRVTHLRFGTDGTNSIAIHPELELDANFELIRKPLPTIESITAARYFGDERQTFPLQLLSKMPNLRELRLNKSFTDAHMKHLSGLTKLQILDAMTTQLTDEGWSKLPRMPDIRAVGIPHNVTRLTLKNLPKLKSLAYGGTTLKSFELENLPLLKTWLRIDNSSQLERVRIKNVRDVALELHRLPDDFELANKASDVLAKGQWLNDETLPKVVSTATNQLTVADTSITAKSVDFLLTLAILEYLDVTNTALRDAEIKRLINEGNLKTIKANSLDLSPEVNDALPNAGLPPSQAKAYERMHRNMLVPRFHELEYLD